MSLWIELHCDTGAGVRDAVAPGEDEFAIEPRCWTDAGKQEGLKIRNDGVSNGIKHLRIEAASVGWMRVQGIGWCCPHCYAVIRGRKVALTGSASKLVE